MKVALGLVVGAAVGVLLHALDANMQPALVAAAVTLVYRLVAAVAYRNRPLVAVMAEEVPASALRYVVPFEARSRHVGADYVAQLAHVRGGTFRRNPPDVGILASLDSLEGPSFDAARVHPLIREFYEHTSRFRLSITPEWRPWMKPGYELFKRVVAQPLGQAAIPSNVEEAQRGMVSRPALPDPALRDRTARRRHDLSRAPRGSIRAIARGPTATSIGSVDPTGRPSTAGAAAAP